ncbi:MAG TPA: hypothetical protein VH083_08685 [Myxococcales bacterium]|nr:hypothetical protein [Myxococcales bacterium]
MADSIQASTPSPDDIGEPAADPLLGDWSEGLPGPAKALDIPAPKLISLEGQPVEARRPTVVPAVQALSEEVETPDGWGAVGEDPLQSEPPPPLPAVMIAPEIHQEALLQDVTPTAHFAPDVTPAEAVPAFLPDVTPSEPTPVFAEAADTADVVQEEVVDLLPEDEAEPAAISAEHQAAVQSEIETAEPIVEPEEPPVMELHAEDAEPPEDVPVWDQETAISKAPDWETAAASPSQAAAEPEAPPADDAWGSLGGGPDWSAPPAASAAAPDDAWGTPVAAPGGFAQDAAWTAAAPAEPAAEWTAPEVAAPAAEWTAPEVATPAAEWTAPEVATPADEWTAPEVAAPAAEPWKTSSAGANTLAQLEGEPEPIPAEEGAAEQLFGTVPVGGSLAEEDENELPAAEVEDPDLPVAVPDEENLPAAEVEDPDLPVAVEEPEPVGLMVPGEHRVAVHTRGGRTRRGTMTDVDLSLAQFTLQPQGGGEDEAVYHAEVKAIFFMLPPGASPRPGGHGKVKVTFADGRSIEGTRDGSEGEHGFFLVPSDAARTNTWRIYIARDATSEIKDV